MLRVIRSLRWQALAAGLLLSACAVDPGDGESPSGAPKPILDTSPGGALGKVETKTFGTGGSFGVSLPAFPPQLPFPLIAAVKLDRTHICPGESVTITVTTLKSDTKVQINGTPSNKASLQFNGRPGPRSVSVSATSTLWAPESRQYTVTVDDCAPAVAPPDLRASIGVRDQSEVHLKVANHAALGATQYVWSAGDGSAAVTTTVPTYTHRYTTRDYTQPAVSYDVQVTAQTPSGNLLAKRTVTLRSLYAWNRARGLAQPPVTTLPLPADRASVSFRAYNPESNPVTLTGEELSFLPCGAGSASVARTRAVSTTIASRGSATLNVPLPAVPATACGVRVRMTGRVQLSLLSSLDVEIPAYFELKPPDGVAQPVTDARVQAVLREAVARGLIGEDRSSVTMDELARWVREDRLPWVREMPAAPIQFDLQGDSSCDPSLPGTPPEPGFTCQPTSEFHQQVSSYILNAFEGDLVLSSACEQVAALLRALDPPQLFSHTGVMVANYSHIRHSSQSIEWLRDWANGVGSTPSDGFHEYQLRYGFPGVMTETVQGAYFEGTDATYVPPPPLRPFVPEKTYRIINSFSNDLAQCPGDEGLTFPTVVNARPGSSREGALALAARAKTINGHYRFYGYSDGAISQLATFNEPYATPPLQATVCSTFIWTAAKQANLTLEGLPELGEWGFLPDGQTLDGHYFYPAAHRRAAAQALYSNVYNTAMNEAGRFGRFLTDAPDDVANQLVNCFTDDDCSEDAKDHDDWKKTGDGRTVSPDNLLLWDAPYGHNEPLVMRTGTYLRKYRWAPQPGSGSLQVRVVDHQGNPVPSARVTLPTRVERTDAAGSFTFNAILGGSIEVGAQIWFDGASFREDCDPGVCESLSGTAFVEVIAGQTAQVTVTLSHPVRERLVSLNGTLFIKDYDALGDEQDTLPINDSWRLSPASPTVSKSYKLCVDGEVLGTVDVVLTLQSDLSVRADGNLHMDEGFGRGACDRGDGGPDDSGTATAARDTSNVAFDMEAKNDDGRVTFSVKLSNLVAP